MNETRFNLLTDAWIPLDDGNGYASYPELLTGERDAPGLAHPRDDCRFFARMLLSALTQGLFPAADSKQLRERIRTPLDARSVLRGIEAVKADFELVGGDEPWMQSAPTAGPPQANETRSLVLDLAKHLLFRPAVEPDALCAPCAALILYGMQSFVPKGGRGYSPGVRGAPPTTTLVQLTNSVRRSMWANTLHVQSAARIVYGPEPDRPWHCQAKEKAGASIGLVEGLFWQPRAVRLSGAGHGTCRACGRPAQLVAAFGFGAKQRRSGEGEQGLYRHPMSPCVRRKRGKALELRFCHLRSDRPTWTTLADWISGTAGGDSGEGEILAAPVVTQWNEELSDGADTSLLVLDYGSKDASITHVVVDLFPLSQRLAERQVADGVRSAVSFAESVLRDLRKACVRLHIKKDPRERLSQSQSKREQTERDRLHDTTAAFWQRTEPLFWTVYERYVSAAADGWAEAYDAFQGNVCTVALNLFNEWAAPSLSDPSRVALIAEAGRWLRGALSSARAA
jgi:CRISPR type I-E-associated protein CasA/Cse1